jgi:outer membrane murein-binding lipoprotein Lpp
MKRYWMRTRKHCISRFFLTAAIVAGKLLSGSITAVEQDLASDAFSLGARAVTSKYR